MKEFKALATERYSIRKFDTRPVEQEKVDILLEVARLAPTAHNYQPQRLLVLNSEESLNKLKGCTNGHFNAPLAIIVCYDNTVSWKREYDGFRRCRCQHCRLSHYVYRSRYRFRYNVDCSL